TRARARAAAADIAVLLAARRHARDPARHHFQRIGVEMSSTSLAEQRVMLADTLQRLLRDTATTRAAVAEGWNQALWKQLDEMGLPLLLVPEDAGGIGGNWEDAEVVAQALGAHAVALPIVETMLARALAARAGLEVPDGVAGLATSNVAALERAGNTLAWRSTGSLQLVP